MHVTSPRLAVALLVCLVTACARDPEPRRLEIRGRIQEIRPETREIVLRHDAIPGYMDAMTMPFRVDRPRELEGRVPGDLVTAVLLVTDRDAFLVDLQRSGFSEITTRAPAPAATSGLELVRPGTEAPDATFVDQDGRTRRLRDARGKAVALTFIYTRCPIPTFCPMMDRHFASIQRTLAEDAELRDRVALMSVSFDPMYDTPPVLKAHAESLDADPATWSFLTGERDDIDRFAARFGVQITRDLNDPLNISHTLRTAVIAPDGTLTAVHMGYDWTPGQVLDELRAAVDGQ